MNLEGAGKKVRFTASWLLGLMVVLDILVPSIWAQTPALAIGSIAKSPQTITQLSYQVTVPQYPANISSVGFEFHAGMMDGQNSTLVKSTISYGCRIAAHKACLPSDLQRFIFYVSVISVQSQYRTQYPSNGYVVSPGGNYTIQFVKTKCLLNVQGWTFSITNSSAQFSTRVCMMNQNFIYPVAGMLELHNVTSCTNQMTTAPFAQRDFAINGNQTPLSWSLVAVEPYIDCNFTNAYSGSDVSIGWG